MSKQNIICFSRLKALACIAVVILHTFYASAAFAKTSGQMSAMLTVRNLMSWAVPCFVMVTGALLLDKGREIGYKKLFTKYILRMAAALVIFSLLFCCFDALFGTKDFSFANVKDSFEKALFGGGWKHMWYLYLMIALYLTMPAYKLITKSAKPADIRYLLALYAMFLCVLPTLEVIIEKKAALYICVYSVYPLYLFAGYALHNKLIKLSGAVSLILVLAGAGTIIALTIYTTENKSSLSSLLDNYSFAATAALSAGMFGLMQAGGGKQLGILDKIAVQLEKCSFGIYLIHMAVLKVLFVIIRFDPIANGGFAMVALVSLGVLIVSFAVVKLLKLIPAVNRII